ncbi:MAG TPA: amidohydrolase family protein [Solirubrobacter sp.]|nr:amidohydrolase family protein [Solirubrobacter sp.]
MRAGSVDAHQHYWRASALHPALAGAYEPEDLRGELSAAGVAATVLVQAADTAAENRRLAAYAEATETVAGVVGWLPLHDPAACRRELPALERIPRLAGVRRLVGREPLDWLSAPLFAELAERGLAWDVVAVTDEQVRAVCALADAVPALRVVVDHLARPPLDGGAWAPWEAAVRELARRENVALKLSVGIDALTAWERWDARALRRPVEHALACFGPRRLMLASNWPVVTLRCDYARAWRDLAAACGHDADVLGRSAERWYRL